MSGMNINIRWASGVYANVSVSTDGGELEVGFLDKNEREELAQTFQDAIDELLRE